VVGGTTLRRTDICSLETETPRNFAEFRDRRDFAKHGMTTSAGTG
jgi:hypothetical protein